MHSEEYSKRLNHFVDQTIANAQHVICANTQLGGGDAMLMLSARIIDALMSHGLAEAEVIINARIHVNNCHTELEGAKTATEVKCAEAKYNDAQKAYSGAVLAFAKALEAQTKASMN